MTQEKPTELYSLSGGIAWYVNYIAEYIYLKQEQQSEVFCVFPKGSRSAQTNEM